MAYGVRQGLRGDAVECDLDRGVRRDVLVYVGLDLASRRPDPLRQRGQRSCEAELVERSRPQTVGDRTDLVDAIGLELEESAGKGDKIDIFEG